MNKHRAVSINTQRNVLITVLILIKKQQQRQQHKNNLFLDKKSLKIQNEKKVQYKTKSYKNYTKEWMNLH